MMPKVIFFGNGGVVVAEGTAVSAGFVRDMVNDFCLISRYSENFGGPHPLTPEQIAFIESWEVENYRKKVALGARSKGRLEGKTVVITGAAQGFGAGIAGLVYKEGANVVVADLNEDKEQEFAGQLNI